MYNFSFPINDDEARKAIIKALDQNIFVIAGAGSGKTYMLVNRMVSLIENGADDRGLPITIDKICAITFTINAAAEFLDRLRKVLKRRANGDSDKMDNLPGGLGAITPTKQERDRIALQNIDLCFAGTIDSFCNLILSEYPIDAKIPSSSSVLTEEDAAILYKQEYARLSHIYSGTNNISYNAFVRLFSNPSDVFSKSIKDAISASFFNVYNPKPTKSLDEYIADFKANYEASIKNDLRAVLNASNALKPLPNNLKSFDKLKLNSGTFLSGDWGLNELLKLQYLSSYLKGITFTSDPNISSSIVFSDQSKGQKGNLYKYDDTCPLETLIGEIKTMRHSFAVDFLLSCAKEVRRKLKDEGKLTFEEYLYTFKELVKEDVVKPNKPLINHITKKFKYFLLDESQDTSPFQYELFLLLCSKNNATDIRNVDLIPGSIFIVGDPKQSIYRFRNADITSYNLVKSLFQNPTPSNPNPINIILELTNNFRSSAKLCSYFNALFSANGFLPLPDYKDISNVSEKRTTNNEGLYLFNKYVDVIKTLYHNPNYQIDVTATEEVNGKMQQITLNTRDIEFKDFMILTSGKKNLHKIVTELGANKIPCYSEDDNRLNLFEIPETIYAIYCFVTYPDSQTYYHNLVTSPLFGLDKKESLSTASGLKLNARHKNIIRIIDSFRDITNPVLLFEKIISQMELFKYVGSLRTDYAYYMLNKLKEAYSSNVVSSLQDGASFLEGLISEPQERVAMLRFQPDAVRIANVHKVKGLEKPVVIILKSGTKKNELYVNRHIDFINNQACLIRIGKNDNTYESEDLVTFQNEIAFEADQARLENERLQYVAVTRARDYLFIEQPDAYNKAWKGVIRQDLFDTFTVHEPTVLAFDDMIKNNKIITDQSQIYGSYDNEDFKKDPTYELVLPSKLAINHSGQSNAPITNKTVNTAAEKGTLIHALMETFVLSDMKYSKDEAVEETLARYGFLQNDDYRKLLTNAIDTMLNGGFKQEDGQKEDLFAILKQASEIHCEYPFSYFDHSVNPPKLFNGTIDLLYKLNGKYYIVDYKTNYDATDLTTTYKYQLDSYVKAFKETTGEDSVARLYHIDIY